MNGGLGPDLGITTYVSPNKRHFRMSSGLGTHGSHASSNESSHSVPIRPHPSHYQPRPLQPGRAPVGTVANSTGKWMIPLCYEPEDDVSTCCLGFWCPHILYGRTQFRLEQITRNKDPLDLSEHSCVNGPCGIFMLVGFFTEFSWIFVMMQHSRIREMYGVDGAVTNDCCAAYACPCCTLMQDDREIRARQYPNGKDEKVSGAINKQPSFRPDMRYISPNISADKSIQHRGSLLREKPGEIVGMPKHHGPEHKDQKLELKKLNVHPEVNADKSESMMKGKSQHEDHNRGDTSILSSLPSTSTHSTEEARNAILTSRQKWRNQALSGKAEVHTEKDFPASPINGANGTENHDPVKSRQRTLDYFEDASLSQIRGKRVLKQLNDTDTNSALPKASNPPESVGDETVLVFYEDGEEPHRHSIADCARLRASTLDRTKQLTCSHVEKVVYDHSQLKSSNGHDLARCPTVIVTEDLKPLDQQHLLYDCAIDNDNMSKDIKPKHQFGLHTLDACTGDMGSSESKTAMLEANSHGPVNQHTLEECAPDVIVGATELPCLDQHTLSNCVVVASNSQPEASNDIYTENDHHRSDSIANQSESNSTTIAVAQQPVITVTPSEASEDATGGRHDRSRSNSLETIIVSKDSEVSTEYNGGLASPMKDCDGAADVKDGQVQLSQAAAALRNVLRAAADIRHGKTRKGSDPTGSKTYEVPRKSSRRSRNEVVGGRG